MTRAELIKSDLREQRSRGEIVDKIHILANGTGYDYGSLFGKYLDDKVKEICLDEPYLREYYQVSGIPLATRHRHINQFSNVCVSSAVDQFLAFLRIGGDKVSQSKIHFGHNGQRSDWST